MDHTAPTISSYYQEPGLWEFLQITAFSILGLITVIFNLFVFLVLKRGKDIFDDVTVLLFRSLATTDIVTGLVVAILEGIVFYFRDFPHSHTACMYMPFACMIMIMSASVHVCMMNLQRFIAVSYPFQYLKIASPKHVRIALVVIRIVIVCVSLVLLPVRNFPMTHLLQSLCESRSFFAAINDIGALSTSTKASLIAVTVITVLPVIILTFTNVRLLIIANKTRRGRPGKLRKCKVTGTKDESHFKGSQSHRFLPKGLKTVIIITFLFYLSIAPFAIAIGALLFQPSWSEAVYDAIYFISILTILSSCWWNVPVYVLTSVTFRQRALSMLRRICHIRCRDGSAATDNYNEASKQTTES